MAGFVPEGVAARRHELEVVPQTSLASGEGAAARRHELEQK